MLSWLIPYTLLPLGYAVGGSFDHSNRAWTELLRQHVVLIDGGSGSQARYAGFKNKRTELKAYLDTLSSVTLSEFERWSKAQQLAFLLNAYNAFTVELILSRMVQSPEQYRWSSYRRHAWGEPNPLLRDHDLYVRLGANEHDRQCAYRELFRVQIPEVDIHNIRECLAYNHPLGNDRFREQVETTLCVGQRQRGRPPKHVDAPR